MYRIVQMVRYNVEYVGRYRVQNSFEYSLEHSVLDSVEYGVKYSVVYSVEYAVHYSVMYCVVYGAKYSVVYGVEYGVKHSVVYSNQFLLIHSVNSPVCWTPDRQNPVKTLHCILLLCTLDNKTLGVRSCQVSRYLKPLHYESMKLSTVSLELDCTVKAANSPKYILSHQKKFNSFTDASGHTFMNLMTHNGSLLPSSPPPLFSI